jgi:hypothetical protein
VCVAAFKSAIDQHELRPTGAPPIRQNIWNQRVSAISSQNREPMRVTGKVLLTKNLAGVAAKGHLSLD